jgi:hypothetical protein
MYRIPIWQGNLVAANVAHAYNDTDVVFQSSSLDVLKFSKYSCATFLMLSVPSSKASKIASSFSTVRTVRGASPLSFMRGKADCSELLSYLRLYVPTYNSTHHNLFLFPKAKTNLMFNSPIVKLQAVGNKINATSDLFIDSYSDIVFRLENTLIVDPKSSLSFR